MAGIVVEDVGLLFDEVDALGSSHGRKLLEAGVQRLAKRTILTKEGTADAELLGRLRAQVSLL